MTDVKELIERLRGRYWPKYTMGEPDIQREAAAALEAQAQALEAYRVKTDSLRWEHGELESRLAAAERDAERYRWLRERINWRDKRENNLNLIECYRSWEHRDYRSSPPESEHIDEYIDAAIDAAREGK